MKVLVAVLLCLLSVLAQAQTNLQCKILAEFFESRGEPLKVSKGVLQVVENRMRMDKQTACQVVKRKGAFPWARKRRSWKITQSMLTRHFKLVNMLPVVSSRAYYFNDKPNRYGVRHKKLGNLYFNIKQE